MPEYRLAYLFAATLILLGGTLVSGPLAVAAPPLPDMDSSLDSPAGTLSLSPSPASTPAAGQSRGGDDARWRTAEIADPATARLNPPESTSGESPMFTHFTTDDGLTQSSVLSILQDDTGFMWFGTLNGLNRYDGYEFRQYKAGPGNPLGTSAEAVWSILEDHLGAIWIGTEAGGLNRLDPRTGRFERFVFDAEDPASLGANSVRALLEDSSGDIWVGTIGGGLSRYDRASEHFTRYRSVAGDTSSLAHDNILALAQDQSGYIWVGTGGGLDRLDPKTGEFAHFRSDSDSPDGLSSNSILSLAVDSQDTLWIGTGGGGLEALDARRSRFTHFRHDDADAGSIGEDVVWTLQFDPDGVLWIGTYSRGVDRLNPGAATFVHVCHDPEDSQSLSSNNVRSVFVDRSGVLWVGVSGGGLNKGDSRPRRFVYYGRDPASSAGGLSDENVFPVLKDRSGVLWVGTGDGGLNALDPITGQWRYYRHNPADPTSLPSDRIWSLFEDHLGVLWVGSAGGLSRFDPATDGFEHFTNLPGGTGASSEDDVFALAEDAAGMLWVGTLTGGLNRFDRTQRTFRSFRADPDVDGALSDDSVRAVLQDHLGVLWVGTAGGLCRLEAERQTFHCYRHDADDPTSLSQDFVLSLLEDRNGTLWVGTSEGGLNRFDRSTGTFERYDERSGLPDSIVYGILEDDQGYLWLSTNRGLSRFDPANEVFRNYDHRDGLQGDEFNANSYFRSEDGELFFGGIHGLNAFYPARWEESSYRSPAVLTGLTQSGEAVTLDQTIESLRNLTLWWPNNFFEFEFATLAYQQPAKNQYAYMLAPFDRDWNYVGTRRFGRYTNLPGGRYVLRLKGADNDGAWGEEVSVLAITVIPPLWDTWLFRGAAVVLLGIAIFGGYRWRLRSIRKRNRELEEQVHMRTFEVERRREVAEGLREILVILNSDRPLSESLDYIVARAAVLLGARSAFVFWCEPDDNAPHVAGCSMEQRSAVPEKLPVDTASWLLANMIDTEALLVRDAATIPGGIAWPGDPRALIAIPLGTSGVVKGGLVLLYATRRVFSAEDVQLARTFADQANLAMANAQLRDQAEQTAVESERNRLARDLHDAVTQTLFSASLLAEALPTIWESDQDDGRELLVEMRRLIRSALAEMRTLLLELRPAALVEADLGDLLRQLADAVAGRKNVQVHVDCPCDLPTDVHVALYRIAQEALNNAVKHAHAKQVSVELEGKVEEPAGGGPWKNRVQLLVSDDGRGFDPTKISPDHLGLAIMRERAQAVGAVFELHSRRGQGTQVTVTWRG